MAEVGIIPNTEVETPLAGARMELGPLREAALSPGRVGQAIGQDVGGLFQDLAQNLQQNHNADTIFKADYTMRKAADDYRSSLAKNPNYSTWASDWQEQSKAISENILSTQKGNPYTTRLLTQKLDAWQAATFSEFRTLAQLRQVKESGADAVSSATLAAQHGDLAGAKRIMDAAVANYAMTPEEAARRSAKFPEVAATANADTTIVTNPAHAAAIIKDQFSGVIPPAQLQGILRRADIARNSAQQAKMGQLMERQDSTPDRSVDVGYLDRLVQDGQLSAHGRDVLVGNMERAQVKDVQLKVANARADIATYDPEADPDKSRWREIYENVQAVPKAYRAGLSTMYDQKQRQIQKGNSGDKSVMEDVFSRGKQAYEAGLFLPSGAQHYGRNWMEKSSATDRDAANQIYTLWQDGMHQFLTAHPDATHFQAEEESERLLRPMAEQDAAKAFGASPALAPSQTPANSTQTEKNPIQTEKSPPSQGNPVEKPPSNRTESPSSATYNSRDDVVKAYRAGKLTRDQAQKVLVDQFGMAP